MFAVFFIITPNIFSYFVTPRGVSLFIVFSFGNYLCQPPLHVSITCILNFLVCYVKQYQHLLLEVGKNDKMKS